MLAERYVRVGQPASQVLCLGQPPESERQIAPTRMGVGFIEGRVYAGLVTCLTSNVRVPFRHRPAP